jgi:hypothetical protein
MNTIHKSEATERLLQVHFLQIYWFAKQGNIKSVIDEDGINEKYPGFLDSFDFSNVELHILFQFIIFRQKWGDENESFPIIPTNFYYIWNEDNYFWANELDWIKDNKTDISSYFEISPLLFVEYKNSPFNDLVGVDYYNSIILLNQKDEILYQWDKADHDCTCSLTFIDEEYFIIEVDYFEKYRGSETLLFKYSNYEIDSYAKVNSIKLLNLMIENNVRLEIYHLSEELKMDRNTVLALFKNSTSDVGMYNLHDSLRGDKEFILEILKLDCDFLKYASDNLKNDREFILEAIKYDDGAFKFCSESLRNNVEFICEAYNVNINIMSCIDANVINQHNRLQDLYNEYIQL